MERFGRSAVGTRDRFEIGETRPGAARVRRSGTRKNMNWSTQTGRDRDLDAAAVALSPSAAMTGQALCLGASLCLRRLHFRPLPLVFFVIVSKLGA